MYLIKRVYVSAGTSADLVVDWEHTVEELYFWAFPDDFLQTSVQAESGTVESWIQAGKCTQLTRDTYRFKGGFVCGYTVFIARKSDVSTEPKLELGAAFPLASLIQAIGELTKRAEEDAQEILRALRVPEAEGKMIVPMKEVRAGKILAFDKYGNPIVGLRELEEISGLLEEIERLKSYFTEQLRIALQEIRDTLARINEIYAEILKYRYVVLTREEYDALAEAGELKSDVIYFVKGTRDLGIEFKGLEERVAELSQRHAADVANAQARIAALDEVSSALSGAINSVKKLQEDLAAGVDAKLAGAAGEITAIKAAVAAVNAALEEIPAQIESKVSESTSSALAEEAAQRESLAAQLAAEAAERAEADATLVSRANALAEKDAAIDAQLAALETRIEALPDGGEMWEAVSEGLVVEAAAREALQAEMNENFAKFEGASSASEPGAKHGKSLLASQDGENGGFYVAGNAAATRSWTQYLTRYQQRRLRVYGGTTGEYEDFVLLASNAEEERNKIARQKDFERIVDPTLVVSGVGEKTEEPDNNADGVAWYGTLGELAGLGSSDASPLVPQSISVWRRTSGTTVNGTLNIRMKIMRWDADAGAWAVAALSTTTRVWNNFANGDEIKFPFAWSGDGIPANEKILIGFVRLIEEGSAGTFTKVSCAVTTARGGMISDTPALATAEPATQSYAPVMRFVPEIVLSPEKLRTLIAEAESPGYVPLTGGQITGDLSIGYLQGGKTFLQAIGLNSQTGSADFSGILTSQIGDFANLRVFDRNSSGGKVVVMTVNAAGGLSTSLNISTTGTLTLGDVDVGAKIAELEARIAALEGGA